MRVVVRAIAIALLVSPVIAADHPDFRLWKADELKKRDAALSTKVGADHSSRETLADFGDHRFRFLYRDADGFPEQHDTIVDVVFVQSGEGTLQLGGTLIDKKGTGVGEFAARRWLAPSAGPGRRDSHSGDHPARVSGSEGQAHHVCAAEVPGAIARR